MKIVLVLALLGLGLMVVAHPIIDALASIDNSTDLASVSARSVVNPDLLPEASALGFTSMEELIFFNYKRHVSLASGSGYIERILSGNSDGATDDIAPLSPSNASSSLVPRTEMGIDEDCKINGQLTPLSKSIVKDGKHSYAEYCYQALVRGKDLKSTNFPVQDCIYVKNAQTLRAKAPHKGQFWHDFNMAKHCFNTLKRQPCLVDLRVDTGCGWPNLKKFQDRCKDFPNGGIVDHDTVDPKNLGWIVPDKGDGASDPKEWLDNYYNHGGKPTKDYKDRWNCGDSC